VTGIGCRDKRFGYVIGGRPSGEREGDSPGKAKQEAKAGTRISLTAKLKARTSYSTSGLRGTPAPKGG
ncbi:TPA: hypothetical protein ACKP5W_006173, partial [Pseudomonas aeruginosa]